MVLENYQPLLFRLLPDFCQNLFASHLMHLEYSGTKLQSLLALFCSQLVFLSARSSHLSCLVCRSCSNFSCHSGLGLNRSVFQ